MALGSPLLEQQQAGCRRHPAHHTKKALWRTCCMFQLQLPPPGFAVGHGKRIIGHTVFEFPHEALHGRRIDSRMGQCNQAQQLGRSLDDHNFCTKPATAQFPHVLPQVVTDGFAPLTLQQQGALSIQRPRGSTLLHGADLWQQRFAHHGDQRPLQTALLRLRSPRSLHCASPLCVGRPGATDKPPENRNSCCSTGGRRLRVRHRRVEPPRRRPSPTRRSGCHGGRGHSAPSWHTACSWQSPAGARPR